MNVVGISALFHDSAACLLVNGVLVAAAQEERFTRVKHDPSFPVNAINYCLESSGLSIDDVDLIVFYEKPFLKFDRILNSLIYQAPKSFSFFRKSISSWLKTKLWIPSLIKTKLNYEGDVLFSEHHESHAAASFFTSPFNESVIVTIDGVGEKACTTISIGKQNKIELLKEQSYPHSVGLLYSAFTQYCGFKVNSGEYKLMGLAPYGKPLYKDKIVQHIVSCTNEGLVTLNMDYFSFDQGESTINKRFCNLFGSSMREPEGEMTQFYMDIASSIQAVVEDIVVMILNYAKELTGQKNLCLSGGVALNCKANGELLYKNNFDKIWVQPASGDAGGALGAAYLGWYHHLNNKRIVKKDTLKEQVYLGPGYSNREIKGFLDRYGLKYIKYEDQELCKEVSKKLVEKSIVGWFQGQMEFGPRALGHRSILASPIFKDMKRHVNLNIKFREGFRPFAPIVLKEDADDWFNMQGIDSKYMLFTVKSDKGHKIPSCIHEDNTARVQTLDYRENELLHKLISEFKSKTECPILINTSFNVRGEPIVESPIDALRCFFHTKMDVLVLGSYVLLKEENNNPHEQLKMPNDYVLD